MENFKEYELELIFKLTVELVQLRQSECKHLCIENAAPEILRGIIEVLQDARCAD